MPRWNALFSHRIVAGTLVGYYGQFIQLGVQLISLPVFTAHWGLAGYGTWLILFTIPSSLGLADFGLSAAGGNTMTAAATRGEFARARAIYGSLRLITLVTGAGIAGAVMLVLLVIRPHSLDFAQAATGGRAAETAWLMLGYGFISLVNESPIAASRAVDAWAPTIGFHHTIILVEAVCALTTAMLGHGPTAVAWAYFLARLAGSLALNLYVIGRAGWLRHVPWRLDRAELRELFAPAMAALVLPGANAVTIQGAVVVIGAIGGPAAVPAFTAVRTLSRTALQFAFKLNFASMPRYTVFAATADRAAMDRLVLLNLVFTAALVVPAAIAILALGRPFLAIWTHGLVHPALLLLALMVLAMLLNAAWVPLSNLIMAINHHGGFAYFFLGSGALAIAIGGLLVRRFGITGMAGALVLQEAAMVVCVWRLGYRLRVIPRGVFAASWRYGGQLLGQVRLGREPGSGDDIMKAVILCGGQGTRIRDVADDIPKPMIRIGERPILWHIMRIYAAAQITDFVLCLGYKSWSIKEYFLNFHAQVADITVCPGAPAKSIFRGIFPERDWRIELVETGLAAQTGARLWRVRDRIAADELFCFTYGDGVADIDVARLVAFHRRHGCIGTVTGVRPPGRFGVMTVDETGAEPARVSLFAEKPQAGEGLINGGFFVFDARVFDYLDNDPGLIFEAEPLRRLAQDGQLMLYRLDGFWQPMDTYREFRLLNELWESGDAPWQR